MKSTHHDNNVLVKTKSQPTTAPKVQIEVEASHSSMAAMAAVPALIGIWAAACFIGGLISSGGPVKLASSWFQAVSGL